MFVSQVAFLWQNAKEAIATEELDRIRSAHVMPASIMPLMLRVQVVRTVDQTLKRLLHTVSCRLTENRAMLQRGTRGKIFAVGIRGTFAITSDSLLGAHGRPTSNASSIEHTSKRATCRMF
ncbi:hypothetical protein MRX96_014532 [Rhipicephalus microplus]